MTEVKVLQSRLQRGPLVALAIVCLLCIPQAGLAQARVLVQREDGVSVWFSVELALFVEQRTEGLMHRKSLSARHGMWFDFGADNDVVMWMKNTVVALDMLFVEADGTLARVHSNTVPFSETLLRSGRPVRFVLELNAGDVDRYALKPGDKLRLVSP